MSDDVHAVRGKVRPIRYGFALSELAVVLAVLSILAAIALPLLFKAKAKSRLTQCIANLQQVNRAVSLYAEEYKGTLPKLDSSPPPGAWWYFKEQVKGYVGLSGPSSPRDKVFACPMDRGYGEGGEEPLPFRLSRKHDYTSYVFNGVNLPGVPNIAGWQVSSVREPGRTLMVMEWTAHAPLSWHKSKTGKANTPFYNDAESVVGFVDGHVNFIKIYYDGMNAAYTRDPIGGYNYKFGGD
jgi:prepilin-type N-terminal cleavage/methylation domain-containing protein